MPFRVWTDGLVSIRVANLTVIVSSKRRRVSVACISYGNTAQLSGEQSGYYSPEKLPLCLSSFTLLVRWLHLLTPATYGSKLLGIPDLPPSYNAKSIEHLPVRTATRSPLTAWKINTSYAIAALMIGRAKLGHSGKVLVLTRFNTETSSLFHC